MITGKTKHLTYKTSTFTNIFINNGTGYNLIKKTKRDLSEMVVLKDVD